MRPDIIIANLSVFTALSVVLFILTIAWIMALLDVIGKAFSTSRSKLAWLMLFVLVPPLGLLLYWVYGADRKI